MENTNDKADRLIQRHASTTWICVTLVYAIATFPYVIAQLSKQSSKFIILQLILSIVLLLTPIVSTFIVEKYELSNRILKKIMFIDLTVLCILIYYSEFAETAFVYTLFAIFVLTLWQNYRTVLLFDAIQIAFCVYQINQGAYSTVNSASFAIISLILTCAISAMACRGVSYANKVQNELIEGSYQESIRVNQTLQDARSTVKYNIDEINTLLDSNGSRAVEINHALSEISDSVDSLAQTLQTVSMNCHSTQYNFQKINDKNNELVQCSRDALSRLDASNQSMQIVYESAQGVDVKVEEASKNMRDLIDSVQKIYTMVKGIDDISAQTNLLSLNASIEAARAGDAGRSFAVVADQIRVLADDTSRILKSMTGICDSITQSADITENSLTQVHDEITSQDSSIVDAKEKLQVARGVIDSFVDGVSDVIEHVKSIAEDNSSITENTTSIAATAEEITATLESLTANSDGFTADLAGIREHSESLCKIV